MMPSTSPTTGAIVSTALSRGIDVEEEEVESDKQAEEEARDRTQDRTPAPHRAIPLGRADTIKRVPLIAVRTSAAIAAGFLMPPPSILMITAPAHVMPGSV